MSTSQDVACENMRPHRSSHRAGAEASPNGLKLLVESVQGKSDVLTKKGLTLFGGDDEQNANELKTLSPTVCGVMNNTGQLYMIPEEIFYFVGSFAI